MVEDVSESLGQISALIDTDIDPVVRHNLEEVHRQLSLSARPSGPGRRPLEVQVDMMESYILAGLSAAKIAELFGVSVRTIRRRMASHGLRLSDLYTPLTDDELDGIVMEIHRHNPRAGIRMIHGLLKSQGVHMQTYRVQNSLRRVDPEGTLARQISMHVLRRRAYRVPAPNSLWHIDGNHKLIRPRVLPKYFKQCLFDSFQKLSDAGGFELLRIKGTTQSQELALINCPNTGYNVTFLKSPQAMIGHAVIYIRPLQRSLNMDKPGDDSSDSTGPFVTCLSCGGDFQFNVIKAHSETCNRPESRVEEEQPESSSVSETIAVPPTSSPGPSAPLTEYMDKMDADEGCSYSESGNDWRHAGEPLEAVKLFRQSIMKTSGEELHFRMDLRSSNESREQTIISFYKRQSVNWTAPLTCTIEGDAAIGDGVKRHCLSTIMSKLQFGFEWRIGPGPTLLFEGEKDHLVPCASQVIVDSDLFMVAGRMIGHSFLHNGPCLAGLSQAVIHVLGGGMPEMASIGIEDCCDTDVREAVVLLEGSTDLREDQKRSIQNLAFGWDLPGVTPENRRWLTEKILFHAVLSRSKKQIKQLRKGLKETHVLDLVTERPDTMPLLFPRSCAVSYSPQQLLDCIIWPVESNSDDEDTSLEEKCRISGFLREYIENASSRCLQELLKFWQGWEVLPKELHVEIVHGQMPQSSTCIETLRLPSHYKSYDVFCEALNAAVSSVQTGFGLV